jgi:hypothetical protein
VAQRVEVDLGVEGGGGQVLMAKDLADRGQAGPSTEQLGGQGVAEAVWPHSREPRTRAGPLDDVTDQVRPDRSARGSTGEEHVAGSVGARPHDR